MKKSQIILLLLAVGLLIIVGSVAKLGSDTAPEIQVSDEKAVVTKNDLREEFGQAYQKDITPSGTIVEVDMTASEGEIEIFEGKKTQVWNYNGIVPGPELRIDLGDTLKVNFTNNLPEPTTIHWHGVRVPNAMDGVPGVNQDPIEPGESFVYEFTPKDAGTFWFHPHVRGTEQVERGLFGTLIVEDDYVKQYDQDIVWVLDDWKLTDEYQVNPNFVTTGELMHDGRWGNVIAVNASLNEQIVARPGERFLLRMVNASNGRVYQPSFDGLNATIVSVDGMYLREPLPASVFQLAPGNRMDVDITIPDDPTSEVFSINDLFTRSTNKLGTIVTQGEPITTPSFVIKTNPDIPHWDEAGEITSDKTYRLNAVRGGEYGIQWTINDKAYPDYDPFEFAYDEFNKIEFINESGRLHPMHLHGQFFKVISRNGDPVDEPFFRDTILVGPKETITIGVVPMDKGHWVQHCHILEHAEAGMMTVVEVK